METNTIRVSPLITLQSACYGESRTLDIYERNLLSANVGYVFEPTLYSNYEVTEWESATLVYKDATGCCLKISHGGADYTSGPEMVQWQDDDTLLWIQFSPSES